MPRFIVMSLGEDHTTGTTPAPSRRMRAWPATTSPWAGSSRRSPRAILAGNGYFRYRGRRPERARPRGRSSYRRPGHQPLHDAMRGQHAIQHGQHDSHDGVDSRLAALEPVRCRRPADVRQLHRQGRSDTVHPRRRRASIWKRRTPRTLMEPRAPATWISANTISWTISS